MEKVAPNSKFVRHFTAIIRQSQIKGTLLIQVLSSRFFVYNSGHHFIAVLGAFLNSLKNFIQPQQAWLGKMWTRGSRCVTIDFFLRQQRSYTSGQTLGLYWLYFYNTQLFGKQILKSTELFQHLLSSHISFYQIKLFSLQSNCVPSNLIMNCQRFT